MTRLQEIAQLIDAAQRLEARNGVSPALQFAIDTATALALVEIAESLHAITTAAADRLAFERSEAPYR